MVTPGYPVVVRQLLDYCAAIFIFGPDFQSRRKKMAALACPLPHLLVINLNPK